MTDPYLQSVENNTVNRALRAVEAPKIEGMQLNADITLNNLVLNTIDGNGVLWVCTDIKGWWNLPDSEIRDIPRGWADGSYDVAGNWRPRQLTLDGVFLPPDATYVEEARNTLLENIALVYDGAWLRVQEQPQKAAFVRLSGNPDIETVNPRGRTEFSVGLRAANPLKYGWNDLDVAGYTSVVVPCKRTSTGETGIRTINNAGNWDTTVQLTINGPITGPATIINDTTGQLILTIVPFGAGHTLEIDTYRQEVAYDGDNSTARAMIDVLANWIVLAPGNNTIKFEDTGNANSTASMTVKYRPAWIG